MPAGALTAEQRAAARAAAGADLVFLLDKEGVGGNYQELLYHVGVCTLPRLAAFARDVEDLKGVLRADFELDPAASIEARVQVAAVICAWQAAQRRTERLAEIEGDADARQLRKPLPPSDHTAMRRAFEQRWWRLEDSEVPARAYLESRLQELEKGDLKAEQLSAVRSAEEEEANPESLTP
eukprot:5294070-Lingulodinium_polyedra.AAC.1